MSAEWYCQIEGKTFGPLSSGQLRKKAEAGRIDQETLVRKGEDGKWVAARQVKGLFPENVEHRVPPPVVQPAQSAPEVTEVKPSDEPLGNLQAMHARTANIRLLAGGLGLLAGVLLVGAILLAIPRSEREPESNGTTGSTTRNVPVQTPPIVTEPELTKIAETQATNRLSEDPASIFSEFLPGPQVSRGRQWLGHRGV